MKSRFLLVVMALMGCLLAGCVSMHPEKFSAQVQEWVPLGTPVVEARRIMERKGFDCELVKKDNQMNPFGYDCLECERVAVWFHTWTARIFFVNDKVSGYGATSVE